MGRYWLHDAPGILEAAGLEVELYPGWELRSRSTGGLNDILGIVAHHTAGHAGAEHEVSGERYSYDNARDRPIGNMHLRRSGVIVFGAAGAANTQGKGGPVTGSRGTVPLNQGNTHLIAIEAHNNGIGEVWPRAQVEAYLVAIAALCKGYGLNPATDVWTHAGYCAPSCPGRKIDAAGPTPSHPSIGGTTGRATWSQNELRRHSAAAIAPPPPPPIPVPVPTPSGDDDMLINAAVLATVKSAPPVAAVNEGSEDTSRWLQAALFKGTLKLLTGSSSYTQAAATKLNDLVK